MPPRTSNVGHVAPLTTQTYRVKIMVDLYFDCAILDHPFWIRFFVVYFHDLFHIDLGLHISVSRQAGRWGAGLPVGGSKSLVKIHECMYS